jgi:HemX protein
MEKVMINIFYAVTTFFYAVGSWFSFRYYKTLEPFNEKKAFQWLLMGFLAQAVTLAGQWMTTGFAPLDRIDGILMILSFSLAGTLIFGRAKASVPILVSLFLPFIFLLSAIGFAADINSVPFMDVHLMTPVMVAHIFMTFFGFSNFTVGFGVGVAFWIQEGQLKQHQMKSWSYRLPALEILDGLTVFHVGVGFLFWGLGLVLGTIQAYQVWNQLPLFDPKIFGSLLVLIIYALFFVLRWALGMRGKKTMTLVMIGYFLALFTFLGVRLFLTTQHTF